MTPAPPPDESTRLYLEDVARTSSAYHNVGQEFIHTTADKVELCLLRHQGVLASGTAWWAPLGILLTIVAVLLTADLRDVLGLSRHTWCAIFVMGLFAALVWLVVALRQAWRCRGKAGARYVIAELKGTSSVVPALTTPDTPESTSG